jgi:hypothetical protein
MHSEVIALLFPETHPSPEGQTPFVTALLRDAQGLMELRHMRPDNVLLRAARLAGRLNSGKPIIDPHTREVIGWEIEPMALPTG